MFVNDKRLCKLWILFKTHVIEPVNYKREHVRVEAYDNVSFFKQRSYVSVKTKVNRKTNLRCCKYMPHFHNTVWALSSMWNTTGRLFCQRAMFFRPITTNSC